MIKYDKYMINKYRSGENPIKPNIKPNKTQ